MSERFLYLTTKGWRSGEPRTIEIWFVERGGRHYVVSEAREESKWVKNLRHDPAVSFRVGTQGDGGAAKPARARPLLEADAPELCRAVAALMDAKYRWSDGLIVEITPEE